jgi:hypothetical protein
MSLECCACRPMAAAIIAKVSALTASMRAGGWHPVWRADVNSSTQSWRAKIYQSIDLRSSWCISVGTLSARRGRGRGGEIHLGAQAEARALSLGAAVYKSHHRLGVRAWLSECLPLQHCVSPALRRSSQRNITRGKSTRIHLTCTHACGAVGADYRRVYLEAVDLPAPKTRVRPLHIEAYPELRM